LAQDVEKVVKDLDFDFHGVAKPAGEHDIYGLTYTEFIPPVVKAIQEQQEIINAQNDEIIELKNRLKKLEDLEDKVNALLKSD